MVAELDVRGHQGGRHTLGELLDEYLRHQEARGRAPKTLLESRRRAERVKADPLASKDLRRLTERDLDQFYARLAVVGGRSGKGMHSTTRHHFHALIRAALNQAIRWHWLSPPNPATEAQAPALAPDERVPPTPEEARRLALAVSKENPDLAALIFVDATTGMRRGEILRAEVLRRRLRQRRGVHLVALLRPPQGPECSPGWHGEHHQGLPERGSHAAGDQEQKTPPFRP